MWVLMSDGMSVWRNLATEEALLDVAAANGGAVFFYRNRPCIVFGKNQNPWKECRVEGLRAAGVPVARRISGGGTVYHDAGNLNYGLVLPRDRYERDRCFDWVLHALRRCGIPAVRMGSTSIGAEGRKLSGTAFAYRRAAVLHHGTLLIRSDLARLRSALRPPDARLIGHAIHSDPAPVVNANALSSRATAPDIMAALLSALPDYLPCGSLERVEPDVLDAETVHALARKYRSVEWRFGGIPDFTAELQMPARQTLSIAVRNDRVSRAALCRGPHSPQRELPLRGLRFRPSRLADRLKTRCAHDGNPIPGASWDKAADRFRTAWS